MLSYPGTTEITLTLAAIRDGRLTDADQVRAALAMAEHYELGWARDATDFGRLIADAKASFLRPRESVSVAAAAVDPPAAAKADQQAGG